MIILISIKIFIFRNTKKKSQKFNTFQSVSHSVVQFPIISSVVRVRMAFRSKKSRFTDLDSEGNGGDYTSDEDYEPDWEDSDGDSESDSEFMDVLTPYTVREGGDDRNSSETVMLEALSLEEIGSNRSALRRRNQNRDSTSSRVPHQVLDIEGGVRGIIERFSGLSVREDREERPPHSPIAPPVIADPPVRRRRRSADPSPDPKIGWVDRITSPTPPDFEEKNTFDLTDLPTDREERTPILFFNSLMTREMKTLICEHTNQHWVDSRVGKPPPKNFEWIDLTVNKFNIFISIILNMSLVKKGKLSDYWRCDGSMRDTVNFSKYMGREIFLQYHRYVYLFEWVSPQSTSGGAARIVPTIYQGRGFLNKK